MSEITVSQQTELTPMQMIQVAFDAAIKQGGALDMVDRILEQQKWMMQRNEEEAYNSAMERIQSKLGIVVKDAEITGKGKYASSKAIDRMIVKLCREEKITLSFDTEQSATPDLLIFVCDATLGAYKKRYTLPLPVDGSGPKGGGVMNKTDATLSAVTKGKRYLKNMIFNLRIEETDDEEIGIGNKAAGEMIHSILNSENMECLKQATTSARKLALVARDYRALKVIDDARDRREKELSDANGNV